jgi:glutathione S-transferase
MIRLYAFGATQDLPDLSPYVIKAMALLKFAGLDYTVDTTGFRRAPKGKLPYIEDDGALVADSTLIRFHLEKTRGIDFDAGLTALERAQSWAVEKMCEDHLLPIIARHRWSDDHNFDRGVGPFFDKFLPPPARRVGKWLIRRNMVKRFWQQGVGRFDSKEIAALGTRDVDALATLIGDKPFLMGDTPCAADASVFSMLVLLMDPATSSATRDAALAKPNLVAYRDRIMKKYFPEFATA